MCVLANRLQHVEECLFAFQFQEEEEEDDDMDGSEDGTASPTASEDEQQEGNICIDGIKNIAQLMYHLQNSGYLIFFMYLNIL
jgi:hypothetical protein